MLFAFAGSLKSFALPALFVALTAGRGSGGGTGRWGPRGGEMANWEFWLLLMLIPSALLAIARYLSFRIRYEGTEIVIRSGILFRNERHVPYLRIQNIDAVRNVAHRLLGVTEVRIETGGGTEPEARISVLHETAFDEMRRRVIDGRAHATALARAAHDAPGGEQAEASGAPSAPAAQDARTLLHLPIRELLLHGFLENRGAIVVGAAGGLLWELGILRAVGDRLLADGWYAPGLIGRTLSQLAAGERLARGHVAIVAAGIAGLLLMMRVVSMLWATTRLYDFRLSRIDEDLRTEYGLFTRVTATIPLRRVQTITIHEGPLQRLAGRLAIRAESAGGTAVEAPGRTAEREWLAPIIRSGAAPALLRDVLPSFDLDGLPWQLVHPRAFRRAVKPALLVGVAVAAPLLGAVGWRASAVLPFTCGWMTLVAWKQVQNLRWCVTEDAVIFRSGWLWRRLTVAPLTKIQAVAFAESPFDRRTAMARVRVDTAGATERSHRIDIPYLAHDTAANLHDRLAAHAAQTTFHW
jgi:putative membrane protein